MDQNIGTDLNRPGEIGINTNKHRDGIIFGITTLIVLMLLQGFILFVAGLNDFYLVILLLLVPIVGDTLLLVRIFYQGPSGKGLLILWVIGYIFALLPLVLAAIALFNFGEFGP